MNKLNCTHSNYVKNGLSNNVQRFKCTTCNKTWLQTYLYKAYNKSISHKIVVLTKEGCGIRSISRILKITTNTIVKRIKKIANQLQQPIISKHKEYEIDELRTYLKKKTNLKWVVIGIEKQTGKVVSINVGNRTNKTLSVVTKTILNAKPKAIYTDGLRNYKYLIPNALHKVKQFGTNKIERVNLTMRTHLKRLCRRTICFSKSIAMLLACVKILYFCRCWCFGVSPLQVFSPAKNE